METLICQNPKNYTLTKGKAYKRIGSTSTRYILVNDRNRQFSYAKALFTVKKEEVKEAVKPAVVAPKVLSEKERNAIFIKTLKVIIVEGSEFDEKATFRINYTEGTKAVQHTLPTVNVNTSFVSCGISELNPINSFLKNIIKINVIAEHKIAIIKACFQALIKTNVQAFIIMSTYIKDTNREAISLLEDGLEALTKENAKISVLSRQEINPNSSNLIRIWVLSIKL